MTRLGRRRLRSYRRAMLEITGGLTFLAALTILASVALGGERGGERVTLPDVEVIEPLESWVMQTHNGSRPPITVYVWSPEEILSAGAAVGWEGTMGYSGWGTGFCWVVVPPLTEDTMWIWRHEFRHCAEGRWHPEPEAVRLEDKKMDGAPNAPTDAG